MTEIEIQKRNYSLKADIEQKNKYYKAVIKAITNRVIYLKAAVNMTEDGDFISKANIEIINLENEAYYKNETHQKYLVTALDYVQYWEDTETEAALNFEKYLTEAKRSLNPHLKLAVDHYLENKEDYMNTRMGMEFYLKMKEHLNIK